VEISSPESDLFSSQFIWNSGDLCTYWLEATDLPDNVSYQWYRTGGATVTSPNSSGTTATIPSGETLEICLEVSYDNSDCTVMECSKLSCPIVCETPSGLQVSSQNGTYFSTLVDWNEVSSPYQSYEIQFENLNTGQGGVYNTIESKKQFNKLRACTEYRVRVRTHCLTPGETSVWSNWVHFNTYCVEVCWETDNCEFVTINGETIVNCVYHLYYTPNSNANASVDINTGINFETADGSITGVTSESIIDEDFDNGITSIEHSLQLSLNPLSPYWIPHDVCITIDYPNGQTVDVCLDGTDPSWRCMFGSYELGDSSKGKNRNDGSVTNWDELIKDMAQPIKVSIYPNPVTDGLWISLDNKDDSNYSIQIFNSKNSFNTNIHCSFSKKHLKS